MRTHQLSGRVSSPTLQSENISRVTAQSVDVFGFSLWVDTDSIFTLGGDSAVGTRLP